MKVDIFKKLENAEIWEFRTLYNGICYRLFSFWDTEEETLVIATHGIVKKTQKTPLKEITKAEEIRKEYFNNKNKPKSVIRISLCRTAKRNPNDRFGFNGFSCVENASVKIGV